MADIIWDTRPLYVYSQTPKEHYEVIEARYNQFLAVLNDVHVDPVTVFNPLRENQLNELKLIREVSEVLQVKKDDDIKKSKAAAEDAAKEQAEQKAEEKSAEAEEKPTEAEEKLTEAEEKKEDKTAAV